MQVIWNAVVGMRNTPLKQSFNSVSEGRAVLSLSYQTRQRRQSGSPDKNHTFKPQLVSSTDGATSKLPAGARVGDASAK